MILILMELLTFMILLNRWPIDVIKLLNSFKFAKVSVREIAKSK